MKLPKSYSESRLKSRSVILEVNLHAHPKPLSYQNSPTVQMFGLTF